MSCVCHIVIYFLSVHVSKCRYGMFVGTWRWQGDLLKGFWWHWWCATLWCVHRLNNYASIAPPLCFFLFLYPTRSCIWNALVIYLSIPWSQWWHVFFEKHCESNFTWNYATFNNVVNIVSPIRANIKGLYWLLYIYILCSI